MMLKTSAFGAACCEYFPYLDASRTTSYEYDFCPTECVESEKQFDSNRSKFCDYCPHKIEKDCFRENTEKEIYRRLAERGSKFRFDDLLRAVYQVSSIEDAPKDKISAKSQTILSIFLMEKRRFEKWKEESKPK